MAKTHWHSQFVFCSVLALSLICNNNNNKKKASNVSTSTYWTKQGGKKELCKTVSKRGLFSSYMWQKASFTYEPRRDRREGRRKVTTSVSASWWGCASWKKKKGTRQLNTLSSTQPPPALHPQQRHIPLNNGHFDQRGISSSSSLAVPITAYSVNWSEGWRTYWLFSSWYTD